MLSTFDCAPSNLDSPAGVDVSVTEHTIHTKSPSGDGTCIISPTLSLISIVKMDYLFKMIL